MVTQWVPYSINTWNFSFFFYRYPYQIPVYGINNKPFILYIENSAMQSTKIRKKKNFSLCFTL